MRRRGGLTGIETAIILIAFVIVAAAFAFAILNVGFQTTQKSQSVISEGMYQASSSLELVGAVIANGDTAGNNVTTLEFTIQLSPGMTPVDLSAGKLIISWFGKSYKMNIYTTDASNAVTITSLIPGDTDMILKAGEKYKVIINVTKIGDSLGPYDSFKIEFKPEKGAVLTIERMLPAKIETVMFLG
jgi:flagellin FlaB